MYNNLEICTCLRTFSSLAESDANTLRAACEKKNLKHKKENKKRKLSKVIDLICVS